MQISAFFNGVIFLTQQGQVYINYDSYQPTLVDLDEPIIQVSAGHIHNLYLTSSGRAYFHRQQFAPIKLDHLMNLVQVCASDEYDILLTQSGQVYLHDTTHLKCKPIPTLTDVVHVSNHVASTDYRQILACLTRNGRVYVYDSLWGKLDQLEPSLMTSLIHTKIIQVSLHSHYCLSLDFHGQLYLSRRVNQSKSTSNSRVLSKISNNHQIVGIYAIDDNCLKFYFLTSRNQVYRCQLHLEDISTDEPELINPVDESGWVNRIVQAIGATNWLWRGADWMIRTIVI